MVRSNEAMECPVCYSDDACCHLVCGHSFCQGCTKEWWLKSSEPNCPMCRAPLYFKGMRKVADRWENERDEKMKESVYARVFNEILEVLEENDEFDPLEASIAMFALNHFDERFNTLTQNIDWEFDEEELYELVIDITIMIQKPKLEWEVVDVFPADKLMFVPKDKRSVYRPFRLARDRTTHTPPMDLYTILLMV
jgi:hypothetical protein